MSAPAPLSSPYYVWNPEEDDVLICRAVREETADVKTFIFAPRSQRRFLYDPGQFLTFEFEIAGETLYRCYTIASAPSRPDTVAITVKRVPNGPVSNWLHDHFRPGMMLKAAGPMGDFSWSRHTSRTAKYLLISGGSGVTPMMSMVRTAYDLAEIRDTIFLHAARSPDDIVFADEVAVMARRNRSIRAAQLVEGDSPLQAWHGYRGRVSRAVIEAVAPDFLTREVFVCGPSPFMAAVRQILVDAGLAMERYHEESFNFADLAPQEQADVEEAAASLESEEKTWRVEFTKTKRVVECPETMTILEAARRAGMRLPSSCSKGLCGTCKSRKVSGEIEMKHQGGIRQREVDAGMMLICCARPRSDVTVER